MSQAPYSKGDRVEIRRASPLSPLLSVGQGQGVAGGAFYAATVIDSHARTKAQILIKYDSIVSPFSSSWPISECVPWVDVRPAPPLELGRCFRMGEAVEAFVEYGWHQGIVLEVLRGGSSYLVFLEGPGNDFEFDQLDLRLCREWTGGRWETSVPSQQLLQKSQRHKITLARKKPMPLFRNDVKVEVRSDEKGFEGAWYVATIQGYLGSGNYLVEYLTLNTDDGTAPLREETLADNIRPYPPRQLHGPFKPLDKVDAWYNDGWWEGIILHVLKGSGIVVYFSTTGEELIFQEFDLRIHQDWINKNWVVVVEKTLDYLDTSNMRCDDNASSKVHFHRRMMVEIRSDVDGFQGSMYPAVILDSIGYDKYLVEYQTLKTENDVELLKGEVRSCHVRPCPPIDRKGRGFSRFEVVDAWHSDGWWMGHVLEILEDSNYQVYFRLSNEEIVFKYNELRPHQEWIGGRWISSKNHSIC